MTEQVFVARERELTQLNMFLDRALAGHGQTCFVTGEAGAGKTALVTEFAPRLRKSWGSCTRDAPRTSRSSWRATTPRRGRRKKQLGTCGIIPGGEWHFWKDVIIEPH